MIKWTRVSTHNGYPFKVYRTNKGYGNIILLKEATEELFNSKDPRRNKSLTNNIEEVLAHILLVLKWKAGKLIETVEFHQWCEGEGLFKLSFDYELCPHNSISIWGVQWKYITNDLKHFEVLYCD